MNELSFFITGGVLGLTAAMIPGPLMALFISETIKHDYIEGLKVVSAILFSDLLMIPLTLLILVNIKDYNIVFGLISFLGAAYLCFLAYENFTAKGFDVKRKKYSTDALKKGIATDLLSPEMWFFWISISGPFLVNALETSISSAISFIVGLEVVAIIGMGVTVMITHKTKNFFKSSNYLLALRLLGIALLYFAWVLLNQGIALIKI